VALSRQVTEIEHDRRHRPVIRMRAHPLVGFPEKSHPPRQSSRFDPLARGRHRRLLHVECQHLASRADAFC